MKIVKFVKIAQNVKKLTLVFCAVLFLLPACKTSPAVPSDTPLSAAREGENAAAETTAEKEVPVPESLSEMPPESAGSVSSAGAESADKAGEPQPLDRIVRAEPQIENPNAESGSDRLIVSEPAPASAVKPAERIESENRGKKSTKSAEKIEPAVKIVRASNTPAQTSAGTASTPPAAQPPAREKNMPSAGTASTSTATQTPTASEPQVRVVPPTSSAASASVANVPARESTIETAQTPSSPTIISRTANANAASTPPAAQPPAREKNVPSAGTASTPAVRSDSTPARVTPAQTSANAGTARIQAENTPSAQSAIINRPAAARSSAQTPVTAAGTKRAESADLSAESGFGLSSEPEVELASEDGAGSSSETAVPAIVPRRSVNAKINQFIDIPYSGRKWIFLGETEATSPPVVRFVNRTFSGDDTLFSVQAKNPGKTVLHFYRQDALENTYIDDYVAVEVLDEKAVGTNEHVRAAEIAFGQSASAQAAASSPAAAELSNASSAGEGERTVPAASLPAAATGVSAAGGKTASDAAQKKSAEAEQLYAAAQKAFEEKRYNDSLTSLQEYEASAGEDSDKVLILRARLYESDSEKRNIKAALEAYEKIVTFFPESVFWDEAKRRSTYLRRFYFDIR
ncbi:hypothetical protein HMPREF9194_00856 [Treponema maltophilum ATCC 51939]|uniref:Outer membrane lipoprotein BamD-like domain-containing protein n=1 Tax=Treponema maltophilum ATCC 51939 TaxID=1125699 RepID=S3L188_TREMA|nr:hypothetical protein [Treponema maltophilum]EPF30539.1 hypothetical protein HMPREF9194_00856 [Treponema maltophilum ATCC 51939]